MAAFLALALLLADGKGASNSAKISSTSLSRSYNRQRQPEPNNQVHLNNVQQTPKSDAGESLQTRFARHGLPPRRAPNNTVRGCFQTRFAGHIVTIEKHMEENHRQPRKRAPLPGVQVCTGDAHLGQIDIQERMARRG